MNPFETGSLKILHLCPMVTSCVNLFLYMVKGNESQIYATLSHNDSAYRLHKCKICSLICESVMWRVGIY